MPSSGLMYPPPPHPSALPPLPPSITLCLSDSLPDPMSLPLSDSLASAPPSSPSEQPRVFPPGSHFPARALGLAFLLLWHLEDAPGLSVSPALPSPVWLPFPFQAFLHDPSYALCPAVPTPILACCLCPGPLLLSLSLGFTTAPLVSFLHPLHPAWN